MLLRNLFVISLVGIMISMVSGATTDMPYFNDFEGESPVSGWAISGNYSVVDDGSGNQALRIGGAGTWATAPTFNQQVPEMTVTMSIYEPSSNAALGAGHRGCNINVQHAGIATLTSLTFWNVGGVRYLAYGPDDSKLICPAVTDQWVELQINATVGSLEEGQDPPFADQVFTVTYNGVLYDNGGAGYQRAYSTCSYLNGVGFSNVDWAAPGAYTLIDNLNVVPEPATMLLVGFGALGLLRRKK